MAKLPRIALKQFGQAGPSSSFGQFGSKEAGTPQTSQNPAVIQQLSAWAQGWQDAIVAGSHAAYLEDMNGWCFVHSYMMAYIFQEGIPEWDATTTYFLRSVVQDNAGSGQWFVSLQDNNLNNLPPAGASNAFWRWVNPPQDIVGAAATVNVIPKVTSTAPANGFAGSVALSDSAVSEDGVNVGISLPLKFPDNSIQTTAASSVVTNQGVVTGSRALGAVFHNTLSRPIFVAVSVDCPSSTLAQAYCDSSPAPSTLIATGGMNTTSHDTIQLFFIVLPGYYYKVVNGNLIVWTEWN